MKNKLKAVLLYLWQLPQHLLALLVILATDARRIKHSHRDGIATIFKARRLNSSWSAVSLGDYVLVSHQYRFTDIDYAHEHGHSVQSRRLGWLYLIESAYRRLPAICMTAWRTAAGITHGASHGTTACRGKHGQTV